MPQSSQRDYCSVESVAAGEPIAATAVAGVTAWILVEHNGPWAAKAWEAAQIAPELRARVDGFLAQDAGGRVQLVKRDTRRHPSDFVVMLASTGGATSRVVRFVFASELEAAERLDVAEAFALLRSGHVPVGGEVVKLPVVLVCTNGKRDRCCAKWGTPVLEAFAQHDEVEAWHTTHLGGHRFAATLLWLPAGFCFGRLSPAHVDALVAAALHGRIADLANFRGRCCWPAAGMAAEHFVRESDGFRGFDDVTIESVSAEQAGRYRVTLRVDDRREQLTVEEVETGAIARPSCEKAAVAVRRWELRQRRS